MKNNFRREYLSRTKLIMKSRLTRRNKIITINTWAVSLMRYGADILKWTKSELDEIDRKTRKVTTIRNDALEVMSKGYMYLGWKDWWDERMKDVVKAEENSHGWYVKHHIEPLTVAARISNKVPSETSIQTKQFKQQDNEERLNNWRGKTMHGQYVIQIEDKNKSST